MGRSETAWPSIVAVSKKRCGAVVRNTAVDVRRHDVFQSIWRQLWRSALRRYSPSTFGLRHDPVELVEGPRAKKYHKFRNSSFFRHPRRQDELKTVLLNLASSINLPSLRPSVPALAGAASSAGIEGE